MRFKKMISLLTMFVFLLSMVLANTSFASTNSSNKVLKVTVAKRVNEILEVKNDLLNKKLKQKFGITFESINIPVSDWVTKMSVLFAGGMAPDVIMALRPEFNLNEWIANGYLKGFTVNELKQKWPNYLKIYTSDEWNYLYKILRYSDGKLYAFHGRRAAAVDMAWLYRKETFDKYQLKFPETPDEFYNVSKIIREKTGKVVYMQPNVASDISLWAFGGFWLMYGIPELAPRQLSYVDPLSKKFIPYAFNQNNYRQALILLNKLYKAGCIWKEFATANQDQLNKFRSQGNGYIMWGYPANISSYNNTYKNTDPNVNWTYSKDMVTAYPGKVYFFKRNPYHLADGIGFSSTISDEKLKRVLEYFNWALTKEGQIFHTFGEYGVTYKKEGNQLVYMDFIQNPKNPSGTVKLGEYNLAPAPNGFMVSYSEAIKTYYPIYPELEKTFMNRPKYYYILEEPMLFTTEEMRERAELEANISAICNEYALRFIMGQLNPATDKDWQQYIKVLNRVGLQELIKIRTNAHNRAIKD